MSLDWKNSTCEDCRFRVKAGCRRFPPIKMFPQVLHILQNGENEFNEACAEYKRVFIGTSPGVPHNINKTTERVSD